MLQDIQYALEKKNAQNAANSPITYSRKILRIPATCLKLGVCRSTVYTLIKSGDLPKPIKLSARSIGFFEHELDDWLAEKADQRA